MTRRASISMLLLLVVLAGGFPLRSFAEEPTPEELLRLGRVAETVERDPNKAGHLYSSAMWNGDARVGVEAGWALARLQERFGMASLALETLRSLKARFGDQMTPERRRDVEQGIARLDAPQAPPPADTSPLEEKIRAMFDRVDAASGDGVFSEMNFVRDGLRSVGKVALPLLEKMVLERTPKTATLAAEMYAKIGQADAVAGLERMLLAADPLTHALVVDALGYLEKGPLTSPRLVAAIDRLLTRPELAEHRDVLLDILEDHVADEDLLVRHHSDPDHATFWLGAALDREVPGALERAVELIQAGGDAGRSVFLAVASRLSPDGSKEPGVAVLGARGAEVGLGILTELGWGEEDRYRAALLVPLARVVQDVDGEQAGARARERIWTMYLRLPEKARRRIFRQLSYNRFPPLPGFFADGAASRTFLTDLAHADQNDTTTKFVEALTGLGEPFWEAFFETLPDLGAAEAGGLLIKLWGRYASAEDDLPPPAYDEAWLALLESPAVLDESLPTPPFVVQAARRSGSPRFPAAFRAHLAARDFSTYPPVGVWLRALLAWQGAEKIQMLEELLAGLELQRAGLYSVVHRLASAKDPAVRALLVRVAGDEDRPLAVEALKRLTALGEDDAVRAILSDVETSDDYSPSIYVWTLVEALKVMHLREGIPYLLGLYRRGGTIASAAAAAMDEIRAYHDRLAEFEAYTEGREEARHEELARLLGLLTDDDPEIRRAAVLALAAMGQTDALPRILVLAKEDPDERVRKAALDAVERMAR